MFMKKIKQIVDLAKLVVLGNTEPIISQVKSRFRRTKDKAIDVITDWK